MEPLVIDAGRLVAEFSRQALAAGLVVLVLVAVVAYARRATKADGEDE